jgi:predicted nucleic acid-binding protein
VFNTYTALFDACVLYPAQLRNLVMRLATTGLFRAKWSATIHEEWMRSVLEHYGDLKRSDVERIRDLMDAHAPDALVFGYQKLVDALCLPDPADRHVLAAAIRGGADVIVTFNLKHFPEQILSEFGVVAQHPDDFVCHQFTLDSRAVCLAAAQHRASLKRTNPSVPQYLDLLQRAGLPKTVAIFDSSGSKELI